MSKDNYVEDVVRPEFEAYMREKYANYGRTMIPVEDYVNSVVLKSVDNPIGGESKCYPNTMTHYTWVGFRDAYLRLNHV